MLRVWRNLVSCIPVPHYGVCSLLGMKKPKPRKGPSKAALRRRLDAEFRVLIMERDGWRCQVDGCIKRGSGLHVSHFFTKGAHRHMRHDPDNACAMCARHHLWWWHRETLEATEWLKRRLGEDAYWALWRKADTPPKVAGTRRRA